jgi:uncharacterized protein (TIGR00255 family)
MTGFGHGEYSRDGQTVAIEISSYNRKQMDLRVRLQRELSMLEKDVRERIAGRLSRGAVTVTAKLTAAAGEVSGVRADLGLARQFYDEARRLQETLGIKDELTMSDILNLPGLFVIGAPELTPDVLREMAMPAVDAALAELLDMKGAEGWTLAKDIRGRHAALCRLLAEIEDVAPQIASRLRERLVERVNELLDAIDTDDERLMKEVVFYVDRSDIAEEITRLKSHLDQMTGLFEQADPVGRKLDFLIQEMGREINTIGSKAADIDISTRVVDFKSELDRIREQVQNIE